MARGDHKDKIPNKKIAYKYSCHGREDHGDVLFGVSFSWYIVEHKLFAVVGSSRLSVYKCLDSGGIELYLVFEDPTPGEKYHTCVWTVSAEGKDDGDHLIAVAGRNGVIRIFSVKTEKCIKDLIGHGDQINELRMHPRNPALILSASKDRTVRLWNLWTTVCVAIFGSAEGHRDEVLSVDFHLDGDRIMSCGLDHCVKLWRLDNEEIQTAIRESHEYCKETAKKPFKTCQVPFADFSTKNLHMNYVDCVRWFGATVLSKSCENYIVAWSYEFMPEPRQATSGTSKELKIRERIVHCFDYQGGEVWFIRFSLDTFQKVLAVGNKSGKIYVWDIDTNDPDKVERITLEHKKCKRPIRQIAFSNDSSTLIAVCDDTTIWRWDLQRTDT